jgi:LmbE family N-acetylglucosaminyl deacetylase
MKKILIISPHGDDELLGIGGYIISEINKGSMVHVIFGTDGYPENDNSVIRAKEIDEVSKFIGFTYEILFTDMDCLLYSMDKRKITKRIDKRIEEFKPNEVYCCYPSHHQDHQVMYECTEICMRLKEGHIPEIYGLYEYPFIDVNHAPKGGLMYIDISNTLDKKLEAFCLYKSQNKSLPSPLSVGGIKTLAQMRGMQCGKNYAELVYIQKIIK